MQVIKNEVIIGYDGVPMATDYIFQEGKQDYPVIIYTHGFNGFKDWGNFDLIATSMAEAGFFVVKYNLSHNGTTVTHVEDFVDLYRYRRNNYSIELYDLQCVLNQLSDSEFKFRDLINRDKIALLGHSRGGAISILASRNALVQAVVTWASIAACTSPWSSFDADKMAAWKQEGVFYYENKRTNQQMPIDYQIYEDYMQHKDAFNLQSIISELNKPMLFIHGKEDPAVSYQSAELLHVSNPSKTKLLLCEGDHVFGRKHPWPHDYLPEQTKFVLSETISFLKEELGLSDI